MHLSLIQTSYDLNNLASEWNELLSHSASHVPFLRHEYLTSWWRTLGGGEWRNGELCVVIARREDQSLAAIAPLFFTENSQGEPALMLLGSFEISDYLDILACPDYLPGFMEDLLDCLANLSSPIWRVIDLYNIVESSPTLPLLKEAVLRRNWVYVEEPLQHCPYIPLPSDWEAYLASLDKKQRHEVRRKMRRAEGSELPVTWYIVQDKAKLDREIEDLFQLMTTDEAKNRFLTKEMRLQMRTAIQTAFAEGWLQLAFLAVGGEKAAAYVNFDYDNRIWVYNSGFNPRFRELSTGWVLLSYLLKWSIENKRSTFDFMRGEEDYKYRFGGIDRHIKRVVIKRS
jgi:CelD/BcsL family acetyltransferase involved in cellulose biosynthesis